jgi:hypothetical protein
MIFEKGSNGGGKNTFRKVTAITASAVLSVAALSGCSQETPGAERSPASASVPASPDTKIHGDVMQAPESDAATVPNPDTDETDSYEFKTHSGQVVSSVRQDGKVVRLTISPDSADLDDETFQARLLGGAPLDGEWVEVKTVKIDINGVKTEIVIGWKKLKNQHHSIVVY